MKTALITGGSSGIGLAFAEKLSQEGWNVILLSRNGEKLKKAVEFLRRKGHENVSCIVADVADFGRLHEVIRENRKKMALGYGVDLLIHSAGILEFSDLPDSFVKTRKSMENNFQGTVNMICALLPRLEITCGHVAVVCSVAGLVPLPGQYSVYAASKAAQAMYCETIRPELKARGIGLTMIYPSVVATPMVTKFPGTLPAASHLMPWADVHKAVDVFWWDIQNKKETSFLSVKDRIMAFIARVAPRTFRKALDLAIRWRVGK